MNLFRTGEFANEKTGDVNYYIDSFVNGGWIRLSGHDKRSQFESVCNRVESLDGVFVQHIIHIKKENK